MTEIQKWVEVLNAMASEDMPCYFCGTVIEFSYHQFCVVCHRLVCQDCWFRQHEQLCER